jgi:hypothetical protein
MSDDWIAYWERALERAEERLKDVPATFREARYWQDVVPYKHILRSVRLKADMPICWGASDCVETHLQQCVAGKHETCGKHRHTCFLCEASG